MGEVYDHLMSTQILTLTKNELLIWASILWCNITQHLIFAPLLEQGRIVRGLRTNESTR